MHPGVARLRAGPGLPRPPKRQSSCPGFSRGEKNHDPAEWSSYFDDRKDLDLDGDNFRVYIKEDKATRDDLPLLVLLHGGGFSGLTWSLFVESINELCHVRALAIDLRGHGSTHTSDDENLSIACFVNDINRILKHLYQNSLPELILMGHSMGGAIAVHYADKCDDELIAPRISGLIVIDVVEGTAKEALSAMQQVLRERPKGFKSIPYAIEWCVRSGQTRNLEAARISMPGQIKCSRTGKCASDIDYPTIKQQQLESASPATPTSEDDPHRSLLESKKKIKLEPLDSRIIEEDEDMEENGNNIKNIVFKEPIIQKPQDNPYEYVWRINLTKTEPFWTEWFDDISNIFLGPKGGAKLLLLAGIDRLDGPMTVGQMQGKFQMQILPKVGHTIQEDDPDSVAEVVAAYLIRNRFSTPKTQFNRPFPSC